MEADLDHDGKISFEEFQKMVENTDVSMSMTLGADCPFSFPIVLHIMLTGLQINSSGRKHSKIYPAFRVLVSNEEMHISGLRLLATKVLHVPFGRALCSNCTPCLLYTSPSPRDGLLSRMPSSA